MYILLHDTISYDEWWLVFWDMISICVSWNTLSHEFCRDSINATKMIFSWCILRRPSSNNDLCAKTLFTDSVRWRCDNVFFVFSDLDQSGLKWSLSYSRDSGIVCLLDPAHINYSVDGWYILRRLRSCFTSVENQGLTTVFFRNHKRGDSRSRSANFDQTLGMQVSQEPTIQSRTTTKPCIAGQPAIKTIYAVALQERKSSIIFKQGAHVRRHHKTQRDQSSLYARQRDQAALEESRFSCGHVVDITRFLAQNVSDSVLDRHARGAPWQRRELRGNTGKCKPLYRSRSSARREFFLIFI